MAHRMTQQQLIQEKKERDQLIANMLQSVSAEEARHQNHIDRDTDRGLVAWWN